MTEKSRCFKWVIMPAEIQILLIVSAIIASASISGFGAMLGIYTLKWIERRFKSKKEKQ
jgi:hypothetical protein